MRSLKLATVLCAASLAFITVKVATGEPTTVPTTSPSKKPKEIHVVLPYSKVTDLSDDQKAKIAAIHSDTLDKIHALEAEETTQCNAVLTPAQKAAMDEAMSKVAVTKKSKTAKTK